MSITTPAPPEPHVAVDQRVDLEAVAPDAYRAVLGLERYARASVDHDLLHLVKLRASLLNGCAFCVDLHAVDALSSGEHVRRLFAVGAWRESSLFTAAERAALALTDAVTKLGEHGVPDDVWADAVGALGEKRAADVLVAIATINVWNRVAVATRMPAPPLR